MRAASNELTRVPSTISAADATSSNSTGLSSDSGRPRRATISRSTMRPRAAPSSVISTRLITSLGRSA